MREINISNYLNIFLQITNYNYNYIIFIIILYLENNQKE